MRLIYLSELFFCSSVFILELFQFRFILLCWLNSWAKVKCKFSSSLCACSPVCSNVAVLSAHPSLCSDGCWGEASVQVCRELHVNQLESWGGSFRRFHPWGQPSVNLPKCEWTRVSRVHNTAETHLNTCWQRLPWFLFTFAVKNAVNSWGSSLPYN